jgi:hypothetical protein
MKILAPVTITNGILTASNVTEDDYDEWDVSTTYDAEDRVIVIGTTHKVYEAVIGANLGNDPTVDDGTNWLEVGATNRWKAFDQKLTQQVTKAGTITYEITPATLITGIAFFNMEAGQVQVVAKNGSAETVYDQTVSLADDSEIIDWYSFFTADLSLSQLTEYLLAGVPGLIGYTIEITVGDGSGTPQVGQIALGKIVTLGETLEGTEIGLRSFSTKEQNAYGDWLITPRAKADPVDFRFVAPAEDVGRVKRVLASIRDTPCVFFAHEDLLSYGAMTYGFFQDFRIPLRRFGVSEIRLEIEGLT